MRFWLVLALVSLAHPSNAQSPMSGNAFDTYTQGRTLTFGLGGDRYGAEQYLPNRRVLWTVFDGECQYGHWYERNSQICFVYENHPSAPQCWEFYRDPGGVSARFKGDNDMLPLVEIGNSEEPLYCPGPKAGV